MLLHLSPILICSDLLMFPFCLMTLLDMCCLIVLCCFISADLFFIFRKVTYDVIKCMIFNRYLILLLFYGMLRHTFYDLLENSNLFFQNWKAELRL